MPQPPVPSAAEPDLLLSLQLSLRLQRSGPQAGWTAQLWVPGQAAQLRFASLPALIGYIARLDQPALRSGHG